MAVRKTAVKRPAQSAVAKQVMAALGEYLKKDERKLTATLSLREDLGLDVLIEVHHERELDLVLERLPEARLIGINNRDLTSFVTSLDVTFRLAKRIPDNKLIVSESGIASRDDVRKLAEAGVGAILVGEALITSKDIAAKVKELVGAEERDVGD